MFKVQNASAKIFGTMKIVSGPIVPSGVGKYFYTTTTSNNANKWQTVSSWYTDVNHIHPAASLPDATTDVVVLGNIGPVADLDRQDWVQPQSINTGTAGATFTSLQYGNISINIVGDATFTGNATYNV